MNFRKKLKIRLYIAIGYIILGLGMIISCTIIRPENNFFTSYSLALIVIGIARIKRYILITKNEETIKKQEIAETDERNICIANKAKSISFTIYVLLASVAIIVLQWINQVHMAMILSGAVGVLILIYWVSYWIVSRKS